MTSDNTADPDRFRERVREATDLVALANEALRDMGLDPLTGPDASGNLRSRCPLPDGHGDRGNRTSFAVNPEKQGGVWRCWACGRSGDCFDLLMETEQVDFAQALRILADRARIRPDPDARPPDLPDDPVEQLAAIRRWDPEALRALGARGEEGRDGRRLVVLPMFDADGEIVGWRERGADNRPLPVGSERTTKSKTRAKSRLGLFYPPDLAELPEPWLIVEGEADAAAAISAGHRATIGTAGASASRDSRAWLQELVGRRDVVLAPDPDAAGRGWRDRLANLLANAGCRVRLMVPDGDNDLDDRLRKSDDPSRELSRLVESAVSYEPREDEGDAGLAGFCGDNGRPIYPRIAEHMHQDAPVFALGKRLYRYAGGVYQVTSPHSSDQLQ